jgi:tRNA nucleotidyltransferase (CCA-adding enzyme)
VRESRLEKSVEIYLVGGAVRDQLLGLPVKEKDWVVVGATPQQMLDLGFRQVGKDFPVFLHPETQDEYALARTERKTGRGYTGFTCYAAPDVTLEEDLKRRDLTINAMAQMVNGEIIDPYGGLQDLQNKTLRHVSFAFVEDPLRILRVARFAARFPDFEIHPTTLELMKQMVKNGEVNDLVAERVWQELVRALQEPQPQRFFEVLENCGALFILFPALANNSESIKVLTQAAVSSSLPLIRFAALMHNLDKNSLEELSTLYRIPREFRDLAMMVIEYQSMYQQVLQLSAEQLLEMLERLDAFRRPERFFQFLIVCEILETSEHAQHKSLYIKNVLAAAKSVNISEFINQGLKGQSIATAIHKQRVAVIAKVKNQFSLS